MWLSAKKEVYRKRGSVNISQQTETHKEFVEKLCQILMQLRLGAEAMETPRTTLASMRVRPTDPEYRARSPSSLPILIIACNMPR